MSSPPSNGRSTASPEPSSVSSHTLTSRYSGAYGDNGEGSSSQPSPTRLRDNNDVDGDTRRDSRYSNTTMASEGVEEIDFASRRQRNRRSGGFLLDSTFPTGPRDRLSAQSSFEDRDVKGRRTPGTGRSHNDVGHNTESRNGVGGGPVRHLQLAREATMATQTSRHREVQNNAIGRPSPREELRIPKMRDTRDGTSSSRHDTPSEQGHAVPQATIDPNQIVHMALNLSESRRRNLSAGQLLVPPANPQRVPSTKIPLNGSYANYGAGSSLRQYLNEQRRTSRNMSPGTGRSSPVASRHMSASFQRSPSFAFAGQGPYNFSPATIARRDKARAYIDLKLEYLRLLEFLPPLKPDSTAPGNFIISQNNIPGSPHTYLTRTPSYANAKYELGRPYNPLQFIRNRRLRARERKTLSLEPDEFDNVGNVRSWVNKVETESGSVTYRKLDGVALPKFQGHSEPKRPTTPAARLRMGWVVTPPELLADAFWLEQDDNKSIIEDRYGRKLFPPRPQSQQGFLEPRQSKEYPEKRRRSWVDAARTSFDAATADESEGASDRGRKRRLLPAFRPESPRRNKKSTWRRAGSKSGTSDSESGSGGDRAKKSRTRRVADINIGPLELHVKDMMEKEAREAEAKTTPTTPDVWETGYNETPKSQQGPPENQSKDEEENVPMHTQERKPLPTPRRTNLDLTLVDTKGTRTSLDDLDSSGPNTPLHPKLFPHIGADLTPPHSRATSGVRKSKRSKLDAFRSDDSNQTQTVQSAPAGEEKKHSSRQTTEEFSDGNGRGTAILSAPGAVKSLLGHIKNDSTSSLNSPERISRKNTRDLKDPSSAVGRFFKGVRHEGSKVGEFIFRKDRPPEDSDSDSGLSIPEEEDSETDGKVRRRKHRFRPKASRSNTATTVGSVTSKRNGHYNRLDLPSFLPSNSKHRDASPGYDTESQLSDDPISRQARARANSRSKRFDQLAPPPIDLRSISSTSSANVSRSPSRSPEHKRFKSILERSGGANQDRHPGAALTKIPTGSSGHSASRPTLEGKRHWSITDGNGSHINLQNPIVTRSEIARVRALLLCSGIKAKAISQRAQSERIDGPSPFLMHAAKVANAQLIPVPKKEEHVLAARILVRYLESSTEALNTSAEEFREHAVQGIFNRITELKSRVETELFPRVRDDGDEAIKISSEVAASAPLTVKEISDEADKILRMRRRRSRWVRRVGWSLVEWTLLGVMWFVWFVVVMLRFCKSVVVGVVRVVRWFLWL